MSSYLLLVLVVISSITEGQLENSCGVDAETKYILWGSDANFTCNSSCDGGEVFWKLNDRRLDDSSSVAIDPTHSRLMLRNFSLHSATLECYSAQKQQVLGGLIIRGYTKPDKLRCMWHYLSNTVGGLPEFFTCSWNHDIQYSGSVNYTLSVDGELCHSHMKTCTLTGENVPLPKPVGVFVRAQTADWEVASVSQEFSFPPNLKMIRPKLNITVFPTRLLAKWTAMPASLKLSVLCQVNYHNFSQNVTLAQGGLGSANVTDVESCSNYTLSVRCAVNEYFWSDWSKEVTVLTQINKKSLDFWRKVIEPSSDGRRRVIVMWKPISPACSGTLSLSLFSNETEGQMEKEASCGNSSCEVSVGQNQQTLRLSVFNGAALLVEESVDVSAAGEPGPRVLDLRTWTRNGSILVNWRRPPGPVSGYMVDWTHDGTQYYWNRTSNLNFTMCDLVDMKQYNITVTPLLGDETGGSNSAERVCSRVGDPGLVSMLDLQAIHTSAIVWWRVTSHEACSGAVVRYSVSFTADAGPELNISVNHTEQKVVLEHLTPETQYRIHVTAESLTGSSRSSDRLFTTKRFDPRIIKVLSVSGTIAILLILFVGIICAVQCRKFKEKPVPNPGLSSLALWSGPGHEDESRKRPFNNPSESIYQCVSMDKPTSPWSSNSHLDSSTDVSDQSTAASTFPVKPIDQSSTGESTILLPSDSGSSSPYRSQNSTQVPDLKSKAKGSLVTTYVTLELFEDQKLRE